MKKNNFNNCFLKTFNTFAFTLDILKNEHTYTRPTTLCSQFISS